MQTDDRAGCSLWSKVTKLKANHNLKEVVMELKKLFLMEQSY